MSQVLSVLPPQKPTRIRLQRVASLPYLWDAFVATKMDLAPTSKHHYKFVGQKFLGFMEGRQLNDESVVAWAAMLRDEKLQPSTISYINSRVRSFFKFLKRMRYTEADLSTVMPRDPAIPYKAPAMFTEEEYEKIKTYCTGRNRCQLHLWLIILGYRTGLSLVDACHLRWCHVHLDDNGPSYIRIPRIKMARFGERSICQIPIIPFTDLHQWLMHLKKRERLNYGRHDGIDDFVHEEAPGLYAHRFAGGWATLQTEFKRIFTKAGVHGKTFKNLRNSFCSNLINSGTQAVIACKMTGHSNIKTLLHYLKPDRRMLQDSLARSYQYSAMMAGVGRGSDPLRDNL